jgi:hypothetical protein
LASQRKSPPSPQTQGQDPTTHRCLRLESPRVLFRIDAEQVLAGQHRGKARCVLDAWSRAEPARGLQQATAHDTHNPPYCKAPCGPASQDSVSARAHRENLCLKTRDCFGMVVVHAMVPIVRVDPLQHLIDGRTASCSRATHAVRLSYQIRIVARRHAPVFCLLPSN